MTPRPAPGADLAAGGVDGLAHVGGLLLGAAEGDECVAFAGQPHVKTFVDGVQVVSAHGQAVLDRHGVAQIHGGVDVGEALALGDAGQQGLDGAEELVGVDAKGGKRLTVGQDVLRFLGLFAGEIALAGGDILGQHLLQLRDVVGVVQPADGYRAEAGIGQLSEKFFGHLIVHGVSSLLKFFAIVTLSTAKCKREVRNIE